MLIACSVIVDLKNKELMNSLDCYCIDRSDANSSTTGHRLEDISSAGTFGLHDGNARDTLS